MDPDDGLSEELEEEIRRWRASPMRKLRSNARSYETKAPLRLERPATLALWGFLALAFALVVLVLAISTTEQQARERSNPPAKTAPAR